MVEYSKVNVKLTDAQLKKNKKPLSKIKQVQLWEWVLKCLIETIYHMNCYWQQDKKLN